LADWHLADWHLADCHFADWHFADWHLADWHLADCHFADWHLTDWHLAGWHLAGWHSADWHSADRHSADCQRTCKVAVQVQSCSLLRFPASLPPLTFKPKVRRGKIEREMDSPLTGMEIRNKKKFDASGRFRAIYEIICSDETQQLNR
jgi:hypothetical protein